MSGDTEPNFEETVVLNQTLGKFFGSPPCVGVNFGAALACQLMPGWRVWQQHRGVLQDVSADKQVNICYAM